MTPLEKASQLIVDYQITVTSLDYDEAVQCSIRTVDLIILEHCKSSELKNARYQDEMLRYWQEVKEILEKQLK